MSTQTPSPAPNAAPLISLGILIGLVLAGGGLFAWKRLSPLAPAAHDMAAHETSVPAPVMLSDLMPGDPSPEAASRPAGDDILFWTCAMHPTVRSDGPGECPICHMDLIPVRASDQATSSGADDIRQRLELTEQGQLLAQVETTRVAYQPLHHEINATGRIVLDEGRVSHVHSRVSGWIHRVFVGYTGAAVAPGDPLVSIYSEELVTAQQELLQAVRSQRRLAESRHPRAAEGAARLVEAARQRLRRWNLTPEQVREIEESGEIQETVTLYYESHDQASEGGVVTERRAVDGQAVAEGDQLFTIADFTHLWMEADVFEYELPWLEEGLHVEIRSASFPGRVFGGTISFIFPSLNPETRTARVRVDIANPDLELRPEMYVDARIHVPIGRVQDVLARMSEDARARVPAAMGRQISDDLYLCPMLCSSGHSDSPGERCPDCGMNLLPRDEVLAQHPELISQASAEAQVSAGERVLSIPDLAVLRTGEREIVFVQTAPGTYERREIVTGPAGQVEVDGVNERWVPVLAGLRLGEEVVTRGNFMLDSQTTLTGGASAAYGSALETGTAQTTSPAAGHRH